MMKQIKWLGLFLLPSVCLGAELKVHMDASSVSTPSAQQAQGESIGTISFKDTPFGLLISPNLKDFTPGMHGFHVHENPSCEGENKEGKWVAGAGAGGHFDPHNTGKHLGPYDVHGHLGDMPSLYCDAAGVCSTDILAPRLTVQDMMNHSIIIHAHGDNFSDTPSPLGGGGARIACGVIQSTSS